MLRLRKALLTDLTSDELAGVAAGCPTKTVHDCPETNDERCVSGIVRCTDDVIMELLSLCNC